MAVKGDNLRPVPSGIGLFVLKGWSEAGDICMCNLYSNTTAVEAMRQLFDVRPGLDRLGNAPPRSGIHPNYPAPVVRQAQDGGRELLEMNWGFLTPKFSKRDGSPIKPKAWNNARDDSIFGKAKGLWLDSFKSRRCLVPASSFCETKGQKPAEFYWFGLASEDPDARPPFAVAGLWRIEREDLRRKGDSGLRHTMVTTAANDLVRPIHAADRMPVILKPDDYETWLTGSIDDAQALLRPFSSANMRIIKHGLDEKSDLPPGFEGE